MNDLLNYMTDVVKRHQSYYEDRFPAIRDKEPSYVEFRTRAIQDANDARSLWEEVEELRAIKTVIEPLLEKAKVKAAENTYLAGDWRDLIWYLEADLGVCTVACEQAEEALNQFGEF